MKALTLTQPWATLVALGVKTVETRSWASGYRGPLAIHAAKHARLGIRRGETLTIGEYTVERIPGGQMILRGPISHPYLLPLGAIVATCELEDVLPIAAHGDPIDLSRPYIGWWPDASLHVWEEDEVVGDITGEAAYGDYTPGRYGWLLHDVHPERRPIAATGRLGLWDWTPPDDWVSPRAADAIADLVVADAQLRGLR